MTDSSITPNPPTRTAVLAERTRSWRRKMALAVAPELTQELKRSRRRSRRRKAPARDVVARLAPTYAFPTPTMSRHDFLRQLHLRLQPRNYFEIGVDLGSSLGVASCPSIGVDPGYRINADISCPLRLYRTTSDDFFRAHDPREVFNGDPVDLGFIDGMHLAEFAYRDFMNLERSCGPTSVVVLDDMLPRDVDEAAKERHTADWAGDVYKVADVIRRRRPDVVLLELNTAPTGIVLVLGLDPDSAVLADAYDSEFGYLLAPDPQDVPAPVLNRERAVDPVRVLESPLWSRLVELRDTAADPDDVSRAIRESDLPAMEPMGSVTGL